MDSLSIPVLSRETLAPILANCRSSRQDDLNALARARRAREAEVVAPIRCLFREAKAAAVEADRSSRNAARLRSQLERLNLKAAQTLGRQLAALRRRLEPKASKPPEWSRLTVDQRKARTARTTAWRHAKSPPRVPMTPEEYRLKRLAVQKAKREAFETAFVGPRWPLGVSRSKRPGGAVEVLSAARPEIAKTVPPRPRMRPLPMPKDERALPGASWDRRALRVIAEAVKAHKAERRAENAAARVARKKAYAIEMERRRDRTPEEAQAELEAFIAKREAERAAALARGTEADRAMLAVIEADKEARREAKARQDAENAIRRTAALAEAEVIRLLMAAPARVAYVPPSRI